MPQNIKNYLKQLDVRYISLVDKGANNRELIYKAAGSPDPEATGQIRKQLEIIRKDEEKRLIYCTVYAPDEADAHGDGMTADEIEKAAHGFLAAGRTNQVDKQHDEEPDEGLIVESFVLKGSDERFEGEKDGSWVVAIKVLDDETWEEIKKGEITGVSLQGYAVKEPAEEVEKSESGLLSKIEKMMKSFIEKMTDKQKVAKDFESRLQMRAMWNAIHALTDELYSIMHDDEKESKKEPIAEVISQFTEYMDNLETNINKQFTPTMSGKTTKQEAASEEPEAGNDAVMKKLDELSGNVTKLGERLDAVEKAAPGKQSEETQDGEQTETKKSKGLPVFGG